MTLNQRKALLGFCLILLILLAVQNWRKPSHIGDPPGKWTDRSGEIQDRINPNTADTAALSAIPNLGEKKAQEIVDYRTAYTARHPGMVAFRSLEDLRQIKGFGPATAESMAPYLDFGSGK